MMNIHSKLPNVGTTIFTIMSQLANEHGATNLSQGFPDFDPPEMLLALVNKYMKHGFHQYVPMPGLLSLREELAKKINTLYNFNCNPSNEITITAGATQAIYTAITTMVHPEDEVIILEPAYDSYVPGIQLAGGVPRFSSLNSEDYSVNWDHVKSLINDKTKMIIINSPHNPTGACLSKTDMLELQELVLANNLFVISDEVYEHIIFDGLSHESVLKYPDLFSRSFVTYSFGKTYHCTGWKLGYCIAPEAFTHEFRKVHQYNVFTCNSPLQYALADFISHEKEYLGLGSFYQEKRDFFLKGIANSRFKPIPSFGTFFQLLDYSEISDEYDLDYAKRLTIENKIASIPVSVFNHDNQDNKVLRFCFAKSNPILEEGLEKLCKL